MHCDPESTITLDNDAATLYAATVLAAAQVLSLSRNRLSWETKGDLVARECQRALELELSLSLLELQLKDWDQIAAMLGAERTQQTLEELTLVLQGTLRATDLFLPQGEGTFLVLLLGTIGADAPTVAFNVRQAIEGFRILTKEEGPVFLKLQCRIAMATLPEEGESWEQLRALLDQRLSEDNAQPELELPVLRLVS